jgi:hypothetical protein
MRLIRLFILSAGIILLLTGAAKWVSASGSAAILRTADPVVRISFRHLFWMVGLIEMGVGAFCLLRKPFPLQAALVAGLAASFAGYRLALRWSDYQSPCPCLGTLTQALGISPAAASSLMTGLLAYLFFGSFIILIIWLMGSRASDGPSPEQSVTSQ